MAAKRPPRSAAARSPAAVPPARVPVAVDGPRVAILAMFFVVALIPRLYGAFTFGFDYDGPDTFRIVNYDEGNACEGALGAMPYPRFVGYQILALARFAGHPAPAAPADPRGVAMQAKAYCESLPLIVLQRLYSAVTGALSAVLVGVLALQMWPREPRIAWSACALVGASCFAVEQSHYGTVDGPQVFFLLLFTVVLVQGRRTGSPAWLVASLLCAAAAVWTKYYVFAVFAFAAFFPGVLASPQWRRAAIVGAAVGVVALLVMSQFESIRDVIRVRSYLLWGTDISPFGSGYAQIGLWRRWLRNLVNLPLIHLVAFGWPACLFVVCGVRRMRREHDLRALWLAQMPAVVYGVYMLVLGPVTYYRHYLPLLPPVALLAASGFWASRWAGTRLAVVCFGLYPLLLTADLEYNYSHDPRRDFRAWSAAHAQARNLVSYYVEPPPTMQGMFFDMRTYVAKGPSYLAPYDYVVLSENWYDTSFSNEVNGPFAWDPDRLIKTRPEVALAYRKVLAGQDPHLVLDTKLALHHFAPELLLHRWLYGSFPLFVGDLDVYRIVKQ